MISSNLALNRVIYGDNEDFMKNMMVLPVVSAIQTLLHQAMKLGSQQKAQPEYEEAGDHRKPASPIYKQGIYNTFVNFFPM